MLYEFSDTEVERTVSSEDEAREKEERRTWREREAKETNLDLIDVDSFVLLLHLLVG